MHNTNVDTPGWLREMETIFEELNEEVVIVDDQLRVIFANEALLKAVCPHYLAANPLHRNGVGDSFCDPSMSFANKCRVRLFSVMRESHHA
jgi:hypothetical protein